MKSKVRFLYLKLIQILSLNLKVKKENKEFVERYKYLLANYSVNNNGALHPAVYIDDFGRYIWLSRNVRKRYQKWQHEQLGAYK